jgi:hypothetical protein
MHGQNHFVEKRKAKGWLIYALKISRTASESFEEKAPLSETRPACRSTIRALIDPWTLLYRQQ